MVKYFLARVTNRDDETMEQSKYVQTTLDLDTYRRLRDACLERNLKLKEAVRVAIRRYVGDKA
jgi:hypothetical protein